MSVPSNRVTKPEYEPEVMARYREFVAALVEEAGFIKGKFSEAREVLSSGFAPYYLPGTDFRVWLYQNYMRLLRYDGGKNIDIAWFTLSEARDIDKALKREFVW